MDCRGWLILLLAAGMACAPARVQRTQAPPPAGTPAGKLFAVHHRLLAGAGVHLLEDAKLDTTTTTSAPST